MNNEWWNGTRCPHLILSDRSWLNLAIWWNARKTQKYISGNNKSKPCSDPTETENTQFRVVSRLMKRKKKRQTRNEMKRNIRVIHNNSFLCHFTVYNWIFPSLLRSMCDDSLVFRSPALCALGNFELFSFHWTLVEFIFYWNFVWECLNNNGIRIPIVFIFERIQMQQPNETNSYAFYQFEARGTTPSLVA